MQETFRLFGITPASVRVILEEGAILQRVSDLAEEWPYLNLVLSGPRQTWGAAFKKLEPYIIGTHLADRIVHPVHRLLCARKITLALAESCTGGMISASLTDLPGSSEYLLGGVVAYSNAAKIELLQVEAQVISEKGAVSIECAEQMAVGARKVFHSDAAVSVTGVAGPAGGSVEKPVGTFCVGFSTAKLKKSFRFIYPGDRQQVRTFAGAMALDVLRRWLEDLPLDNFLGQSS